MDYSTNKVVVSYDDLAAMMNCGTSTVYRSVKKLLSVGVITRTNTQGTNSYIVVSEELMKSKKNDWEDFSTIGEDLDKPLPPQKTKGRLQRLINYFSSEMQRIEPMAITAPVNGGALSKHFKELMDEHGITEDQVRQMINMFVMDLEMGRTKRGDAPAWRLFLYRREYLFNKVTAPGSNESPFLAGGS